MCFALRVPSAAKIVPDDFSNDVYGFTNIADAWMRKSDARELSPLPLIFLRIRNEKTRHLSPKYLKRGFQNNGRYSGRDCQSTSMCFALRVPAAALFAPGK